ncbi:MAG: sugar transferase [Syntrophobacteraceae bacterium]
MILKRIFDIVLGLHLLMLLAIPAILIGLAIKITSTGPILYRSNRIGRDNAVFVMYKFRTMNADAPAVATHLMRNPGQYLAPLGNILRESSIDEIPQLYNILKGDMSFVGPRPALFNQYDLISMRTRSGIHRLLPGLTGWAQINGRDDLPISVKVRFDRFYLQNKGFLFDLRILLLSFTKVFKKEGVSH